MHYLTMLRALSSHIPFLRSGIILCLSLLAVGVCHAKGNMYAVSGVRVDKTASTITEAKKAAFQDAKTEAFKRLIQRLTRQSETRVETTPSQLNTFVHSSTVESEKRSSTRYIATLTFHFNKAKVENFLTEQGIDFHAYEIKPVLVVPILDTYLWEPENTKLSQWSEYRENSSFIQFELPEGGLQDIQDLSVHEALDQNVTEIQKLIERYNTEGAVILHYTGETVKGWYISAVGDVSGIPLSSDSSPKAITKTLEKFIRDLSVLEDQEKSHLDVAVFVKNQRDWHQTRSTLKNVPNIKALKIKSLSPQKVNIAIDFVGNVGKLKERLKEYNLQLNTIDNGDWVLTPAS